MMMRPWRNRGVKLELHTYFCVICSRLEGMVCVLLADSKQLDGMLFLKGRLVFADRFQYI